MTWIHALFLRAGVKSGWIKNFGEGKMMQQVTFYKIYALFNMSTLNSAKIPEVRHTKVNENFDFS